jgi:DegV family protein with EDD domain
VGVALVTDSTADLDFARAAALGIAVVPLSVIFGARSFRDVVDLGRDDFYERLRADAELPATAAPAAGAFEEVFRSALERGDDVLCLTLSGKLSGTLNAARAAAAAFPEERIAVVDSMSVSGGMQLLLERAHHLAETGASVREIVGAIERLRGNVRLHAALPDLSHLRRTGRIGTAAAVVGSLMRIVPVLSLEDGEVTAVAQVRTFQRACERMLDLTVEAIRDPGRTRFIVMHTHAPSLAERIAAQLRERFAGTSPRSLEITEAGPAVAVHAGAGATGIFFLEEQEPE